MRPLTLLAALVAVCTIASSAAAQAPDAETAYADGQTVTITAIHFLGNPTAAQLSSAGSLYIAAYPWNGSTAPTFASDYTPGCDPCSHSGLPEAFSYHDHILSGAPALGDAAAVRHLIIVLYNDSVLSDPHFQPARSITELKADEAAGLLQPLAGPQSYEFDTGLLVVAPTVSPNA